jgi:hypothetical protein
MRLQDGVHGLPARALRRLASLPAEAALRVINTAPVERRLSQRYDQAQRAHAGRMPALSKEDSFIVEALKADGVFVTSLDALRVPRSSEMLAQATALGQILAQRTADTRPTRSATADDLMSHPEIFAWGMSTRLLGVVEAYLGLPVAYDGPCYFHGLPDGTETGIRLWHFDREDRRQIKIGVYISDVGEADGPLQCLSRSVTRRVEPTLYKYKPFTHAELARRLGSTAAVPGVMKTITGPPGTVILIDTAQLLHRGSPPTALSRSVIYFHYFSRTPRHPFFCERSPLSRAQLRTLVQTAEPCQRDAVQWRATLPRGVKLIPKSVV